MGDVELPLPLTDLLELNNVLSLSCALCGSGYDRYFYEIHSKALKI